MRNTAAIIDAERAAGVFWEPAVQAWAAGHDGLIPAPNQFYLLAHLPVAAVDAPAEQRTPGGCGVSPRR